MIPLINYVTMLFCRVCKVRLNSRLLINNILIGSVDLGT